MSLSYYDDRQRPRFILAKTLMVINALIAFGMAFYWSGLAGLVAEPFKWAMRDGVSPAPNLFEYPFLTLWLVPTLCMCAGWLAMKAERETVSRIVGAWPTMMLSLMLGWYYLTPPHWH